MPRPPLIRYSRGIHDISNGLPVSTSTNPSTAGNPSQPRLWYAERLKANGTAAKEKQLSYPVPNSTVSEVSVKLTPADREDSLWESSLKIHLTGRNAAGISRDALRAALVAVGINKQDIVALWRGEVGHEINVTFSSEGAGIACPNADTIELPNGVKGNFLHANRTLADVKVHWVPALSKNQLFVRLFEQLGTVRDARTVEDDSGLQTGVRTIRVEMARENLPKIPHLIKTEEEGLRFLVTVKGRQPKCLGCGVLGHTRSDCPQSSGGYPRRRPGQQQQLPTKMTSLGHVPGRRPPAAMQHTTTTEDTSRTTTEGQGEAAGATDPPSSQPDQPPKPDHPSKPDQTDDLQPDKSSQDSQGGDKSKAADSDLEFSQSEEIPDTQQTAASDDSIPCGQSRFRSTQEMELTQARHQGLPPLVPGPTRAAYKKQKRVSDVSEDIALKRQCVPLDSDEETMDSQETDFESGGNKFFTPGESGNSQ